MPEFTMPSLLDVSWAQDHFEACLAADPAPLPTAHLVPSAAHRRRFGPFLQDQDQSRYNDARFPVQGRYHRRCRFACYGRKLHWCVKLAARWREIELTHNLLATVLVVLVQLPERSRRSLRSTHTFSEPWPEELVSPRACPSATAVLIPFAPPQLTASTGRPTWVSNADCTSSGTASASRSQQRAST